jgi:hypothetical protein
MGQKARLKKARRSIRALIGMSEPKERLSIAQSAWEHGLFSKRQARKALENVPPVVRPDRSEPEHAPIGVEVPKT